MYIHNWRYLHLIAVAPPCIGVISLYFLPESPRWLVSHNRLDEDVSTLYRAYRINHLLDNTGRPIMTRRPYQTGELTKYSIVSKCIFAGQLCCFFGLLLYTRILRGSIYLIAFINALTSLPGSLLSTLLYSFVRGRHRPLLALYSMAGIVLLIGGLYTVILQPSLDLALVVCCNLAFTLLEAAFNMIFSNVPELFPSAIRTEALGNASGLGRVGSILSSFINELDKKLRHGLPILVYAAVAFTEVVLLFCTLLCMPVRSVGTS
ncbi:unnamed protein product [Dibothriocephalus latus]|uniref:Major facilitator superfamily (MFS) profile domain-containing protein n=1 Tax=Dibothriocephalus latus TaxID=60516 RepID=A0A3P7NSD9_DIBLA|nr:unnamed protein product [Dibothriocephalus latus]